MRRSPCGSWRRPICGGHCECCIGMLMVGLVRRGRKPRVLPAAPMETFACELLFCIHDIDLLQGGRDAVQCAAAEGHVAALSFLLAKNRSQVDSVTKVRCRAEHRYAARCNSHCFRTPSSFPRRACAGRSHSLAPRCRLWPRTGCTCSYRHGR